MSCIAATLVHESVRLVPPQSIDPLRSLSQGWSGPNCDVESGGSASAGLGPLGSGTVAGITVGAVVALALVAALVILYRKNRAYAWRKPANPAPPTPLRQSLP